MGLQKGFLNYCTILEAMTDTADYETTKTYRNNILPGQILYVYQELSRHVQISPNIAQELFFRKRLLTTVQFCNLLGQLLAVFEGHPCACLEIAAC